jgi:hypothetical protein
MSARPEPARSPVATIAPPVTRTVVPSEVITARYVFRHGERSFPIERWEFDVVLRAYHPSAPLTMAVNYKGEHTDPDAQETFATIACWEGNPGDLVERLILIAIPKDGKPESDQS